MPFLVWTSVVWPMVISSRCPITHILCLNTMAMKYLCGSDLHLSRKYAGKTTIQINQATNCIDVDQFNMNICVCNCCWCFGWFWNFIRNVSEIIYCEKLEVIKWNEWVTQIYEWTKKNTSRTWKMRSFTWIQINGFFRIKIRLLSKILGCGRTLGCWWMGNFLWFPIISMVK